MADRETLLSTLPEEVRPDAERLYAEDPNPNPHDIVAELHQRGLLRDEQLRDTVLALEASLHVGRMQRRPPEKKLPTILGPLGAGAMGEVLIAKDEGLNRIVAVKRLLPELASRPAILERFYKEAQITAQLDHPAIVPIHGLVEPGDGSLAYTMKLVRGRTLDAYLDEARDQWRRTGGESGSHVLTARLERFLHVCDAIAYAHDRGVVHRDLKPENVMVGAFGEVLVMDWGIAKVLEQQDEPMSEQGGPTRKTHGTRVGTVFGTPRYMSPEQAEGKNDVLDARSDQYALGLCLQEIVTLRPAIDPLLELEQCLEWARAGRRQPMTHLHRRGSVPRELDAIVARATARDPAKRYPSVGALGDDVRRYLRDEAVSARPDTLVQRVMRWIGHHRGLVVTLILGLLLVLVVVTGTMGAGALGIVEWRRRVAAGREEALTGLLAQASAGATEIERTVRFAEYQLVGLSFAAEAALGGTASEAVLNYDPLDGADPPKKHKSEVYGRDVSVERPSFSTSSAAPDDPLRARIRLIAGMTYSLSRVLVDSGGEDQLSRKQRRERIVKQGVPIRWARLATDEVLAVMPGTEPFRTGVDPTKLPWYRNDDREGIVWMPPRIDPDGTGLVLTASRPFYDFHQDKIGTVAIDLTVDALADLLVPPEGAREAFLVDAAGQMVAWKDMHAAALKKIERRPVPIPDLAHELEVHPDGWLEVGGEVAAWKPVPSLGWRYVVIVDHGL